MTDFISRKSLKIPKHLKIFFLLYFLNHHKILNKSLTFEKAII